MAKAAMSLAIPAIAFGNRQLLEESGQTQVEHRIAFPTGFLPQGTGNPGFANAGGSRDEHVVPVFDPLARGQSHHQGVIEPPWKTVVKILDSALRRNLA